MEQDLTRGDIPGSHEKTATSVLMEDCVGKTGVVDVVGILELAGGGAVHWGVTRPTLDIRAGCGTDHTRSSHHGAGQCSTAIDTTMESLLL